MPWVDTYCWSLPLNYLWIGNVSLHLSRVSNPPLISFHYLHLLDKKKPWVLFSPQSRCLDHEIFFIVEYPMLVLYYESSTINGVYLSMELVSSRKRAKIQSNKESRNIYIYWSIYHSKDWEFVYMVTTIDQQVLYQIESLLWVTSFYLFG